MSLASLLDAASLQRLLELRQRLERREQSLRDLARRQQLERAAARGQLVFRP